MGKYRFWSFIIDLTTNTLSIVSAFVFIMFQQGIILRIFWEFRSELHIQMYSISLLILCFWMVSVMWHNAIVPRHYSPACWLWSKLAKTSDLSKATTEKNKDCPAYYEGTITKTDELMCDYCIVERVNLSHDNWYDYFMPLKHYKNILVQQYSCESEASSLKWDFTPEYSIPSMKSYSTELK